MNILKIINILDEILQPNQFKDYCPNGLQVDTSFGQGKITKIVSGVTACQLLIDSAVRYNANALLVHHGFFWRNDDPAIRGAFAKKIATLFEHNISLIAYHLPLDAHKDFGNNVQLAKIMDWEVCGNLQPNNPTSIGNWGMIANEPISLDAFASDLENKLARKPLCISAGDHMINKIAWCTGAAQGMIHDAVKLGVDAFISGEISEATVHFARENNIHYISAGHHATERYGVQALGEFLEQEYSIEHQFIDIHSPA